MKTTSTSDQPVELLDYAHPFRHVYTGFWILVAGLCVYFLWRRPDSILAAGLVASLGWAYILGVSRQKVLLFSDRLMVKTTPALWRRPYVWQLSEIQGVELESSLSLDDREITRPQRYKVLVHEKSGRFRPLIELFQIDVAQALISAIEAALTLNSSRSGAGKGLK